MSSAHLTTDPSSGILVAKVLCEKISEYEATVLEPELRALAADHQYKLVLDMTSVEMIASVGLGMLVQLNRAIKQAGGKFVLANLSENIKKVMKITRLDAGLTITGSVADGIAKAK
jgi:anti-anti-sigma factor